MRILSGTLFVCLLAAAGSSLAQDDISGVWEGSLEAAPGTVITVLFDLSRDDSGSYSAVLNSPDMGAIKDIAADTVTFDGSQLQIEVAALSGSYSGAWSGSSFEGEWSQPGADIPMELSPFEAYSLSQEAIDTLLGQWSGQLVVPGGEFTIVFHFEMNDEGEFVGFLQNASAGPARQPVDAIRLEDGALSFNVPNANAQYRGTLEGDDVTGNLVQGGNPLSLNVSRGYEEQLPELALTEEDFALLEGSWVGEANGSTVMVTFERHESGVITASIGNPDIGSQNNVRASSADLADDGALTLAVAIANMSFEGRLDGETIEGTTTQGGASFPVSLTRIEGEYVREVAELALTDADLEVLEGRWQGSLGPLTIIFTFGRNDAGTIIATLDVPQQNISGLAATEASFTDGELNVVLPIGASYTGAVDGDSIEGQWSQGGRNLPLVFARSQ